MKIPIDEEYFWTDSKVVLSYVNNEAKRFHVFVANRVQKIRQLTEPKHWHYVSTKENPADHASRGLSVAKLLDSNWFKGPDFLWSKTWEPEEEEFEKLHVGDPEIHKITTLNTQSSKIVDNFVERLSSFSKWSLAVGALARLRRVVQRVKGGTKPSSCVERNEAEIFIVKSVQRQAFHEEVKALLESSTLKSTSSLYNLDPFLGEQGVLRVGGRLRKATMPTRIKHPVILPKDCHITQLLIQHFHEKIQHQGRGMTLNEIRANGYWIIGGTKAVQSCIHKCVMCRKVRRPLEEQKMADLPEDRLEPSPPFTSCGMDCFGPFMIRKGRKEFKRYGLIITCLCCRGIHVEMLEDMSTDCLINALRCFIAIRGAVRQFRCDQGSNFVGAKNELRECLKELDSERLEAFLAKRQCEFVFNSPSSSHAGGVWERQIKTIRNILNVTLSRKTR